MENRYAQFADILRQYRARRRGLTQARLAALVGYDPAVITRMCRGLTDLTGPGGRERVVRLLQALHGAGAVDSVEEADALLAAAGMPPLYGGHPAEAALLAQLRARGDARPDTRPPPKAGEGRPGPPAPLTSFVGREREVAEVKRLLSANRLVTLTGPGGVGKTRLVREVVRDLPDGYPDGVGWVELAPLTDPALVVQAAANALRVYRPGGREGRDLLDALAEQLEGRRALLALDNCEHLVGACAKLAEHLAGHCHGLRILATSREPLRVPGEAVLRLPPLGTPGQVPAAVTSSAVDRLLGHGAVRLFVERARAACPGFNLTPANAAAVAHVCQQLDGLPLALELAAALTPALSVEELAARLGNRLALLKGGYRTAEVRHQALSGAMDWSYELLPVAEQALFDRLSVFSGGWTLEAAESVAAEAADIAGPPGGFPQPDMPSDTLFLLSELVSKSLVVAERDGGQTRFSLLVTLRDYAREHLSRRGGADALRDRHLGYYVALAERASAHLFGESHATWMGQLEAEHANLREALAWGLARARDGVDAGADAVLRLIFALWLFWGLRDHADEAVHWLREALDLRAVAPPALRAQALYLAARDEVYGGDPTQVSELTRQCRESLTECRERDEPSGVAYSLLALVGQPGEGRLLCGDAETAAAYAAEALRLFESLGDAGGAAEARSTLSRVLELQGQADRLMALLEANARIFRQTGDGWHLYETLTQMALAAQAWGDEARGDELTRELIALSEEVGEIQVRRAILGDLGGMALLRGRPGEARAYLAQSLEIALEIGDRNALYWGLTTLCNVDHPRALVIAQEYLARQQREGDQEGVACALYYLGIVLQDGGDFDYAQSRDVLEQSLALWRELGVTCAPYGGTARVLINLGQAFRFQGDSERAAACYTEAIRLARAEGDRYILRPALLFHAYAMLTLGRPVGALASAGEVIRMCRGPAGRPDSAMALAVISEVAWRNGQTRLSARLSGAASAQADIIRTGPHNWRVDYERFMSVARQRCDDPAYANAWEEGRQAPLDQAGDRSHTTRPESPPAGDGLAV